MSAMPAKYLSACLSLFAAATLALPGRAAAASVSVGEVDIGAKSVGEPVTIPVSVSGADPDTFAGFQFEVGYDPAVLEFDGASRGELIDMEGVDAVAEYAPYLWGLEAGPPAAGKVAVVGMLLPDPGDPPDPDVIIFARIPAADGVLVNLHFTLLQKTDSVVEIVVDADPAENRTLLAFDAFTAETDTEADPPAALALGGASASGVGIAYQMEYFGFLVEDTDTPAADGFSVYEKFLAGVDPTVTTYAMLPQHFEFLTGWNLVAFQYAPTDDAVADVFGDIWGDFESVWTYDTVAQDWVQYVKGIPEAFNTLNTIEPYRAYWVRVTDDTFLSVDGGPITDDAVELLPGWNLVGLKSVRAWDLLEALLGIQDSYESVWTYDTAADDWLQYVKGIPPAFNTLHTLERQKGYWIRVNEAADWVLPD